MPSDPPGNPPHEKKRTPLAQGLATGLHLMNRQGEILELKIVVDNGKRVRDGRRWSREMW